MMLKRLIFPKFERARIEDPVGSLKAYTSEYALTFFATCTEGFYQKQVLAQLSRVPVRSKALTLLQHHAKLINWLCLTVLSAAKCLPHVQA